MNTSSALNFSQLFNRLHIRRGLLFGSLIIAALIAFETFNYSTTDYALSDLLGKLAFLGVRWSTILAIAFCGIDFAGIARLFTPQEGGNDSSEAWYLFGAWMLAATMNAMLTWWGVSLAILNHETLGNAVVARHTLLRVVPIFVAVMVWLIRVLIIGTFSVAGDRLFSQGNVRGEAMRNAPIRSLSFKKNELQNNVAPMRTISNSQTYYAPLRRPTSLHDNGAGRTEPSYHPLSMSGHNSGDTQARR